MKDIKLTLKFFGSYFESDCDFENTDLVPENSLETAVILSLLLDARAKDDDILPDNSHNKRGWWADHVFPEKDNTGSRLWLLSREKTLPEVLRKAKTYAEEALTWLIEEKRAKKIHVTPSMPAQGILHLHIEISLIDNSIFSTTIQRNISCPLLALI